MPTTQALIIDDNSANLLVLQHLLKVEQVTTYTLSDTRNFEAQLDQYSDIDVVFLDLEMPVLNGYEALEIIRSHQSFQSARVVAYSVHINEMNNALNLGFDGFVGKPLDADAFPEQLSRILKGELVKYIP